MAPATQPSLARKISSNPTRYFVHSLGAIVLLVLACIFSFIFYPIQLAFDIRIYRNPNCEMKRWTRYLLITMLCLSSLEIGSLGLQLWWALKAGSVEKLHLGVFRWWQYAKNAMVLCVFLVEVFEFKCYTKYLDSWLERTKQTTPEDDAEKGSLKRNMLLDERLETLIEATTSEKSSTSTMVVSSFEDDHSSLRDEGPTIAMDEKV